MEEKNLREMLEGVHSGEIAVDDALSELRDLPFETVGDFVRIDHHRALRQGFPEVVFAQGKTPEQVTQIMVRLAARGDRVMASRADAAHYEAVKGQLPDAVYHERPRVILLDRTRDQKLPGVLVATGGTSDIPVAEEAALTAELMGNKVERLYDVGVAGIHRLLAYSDMLRRAHVVVVAAGMEGALASVVGGLVSAPVIAVPTSIGYGASFGGVAALLSMLNSCSTGVAVVNIDNGFGAGYMAGLINRIAYLERDAAETGLEGEEA